MRIIAGKHKGRSIELEKEPARLIRPTSDFARESIFNVLTHSKHSRQGESFIGKRVLDCFSGTGAFGLEALSRGAAHVTFIDNAREALNMARHNAAKLKEEEQASFFLADASKLGKARQDYSLVFLDPPYFSKLIPPTLLALHKGGWLAEDALVVTEHDAKENVDIPESYELLDERKYGRAIIKLLKPR